MEHEQTPYTGDGEIRGKAELVTFPYRWTLQRSPF